MEWQRELESTRLIRLLTPINLRTTRSAPGHSARHDGRAQAQPRIRSTAHTAASTRERPMSLLLDFDGTLVPIVATPDAIVVSDDLHALIAEAMERLTGVLKRVAA